MSKIAVLGSSGQIGAYLVNYLRELGNDVDGYDVIPETTTNNITDLRYGNINLHRYDFVYFLAFDVGGSTYLKTYQHTAPFMNNNMKLMSNIFEQLQGTRVPFMFTSSQMASMSYSPYGLLKHLGELNAAALGGLVVKFWNVYGIEHDLEKAHVITDFILKAKNGKIDMMTDGTEVRQFLYAEDCCECMNILMNQYDSIDRDQELHITNFEWDSIIDIANTIKTHFPDTIIEPGTAVDTVQKDARNEPDPYIKNYWSPKTNLETGIKLVVEGMEAGRNT